MAKGGGSANKSYLFQETKALLNPTSLMAFLDEKLRTLGTAACPPYHLAVVIGGTSAEYTLKMAKYASARYLDTLPTTGNDLGRGFRDVELEQEVLELTAALRHRRPVRRQVLLPRRAGDPPAPPRRLVPGRPSRCRARPTARRSARSPPTASSSSSSRRDPASYLPETTDDDLGDDDVVRIDLNRPMDEIRAELSKHPVKTRLSLTGPMVVARDIAHAKIKERLDAGEPMPQYLRDHCVYYAGPAKTPEGYASGSFGPTTAGRMDAYVDQFQAAGGSLVMLAKGNRVAAGHRRLRHATAASTSARSAARPPAWPRTASPRSRCSSTPSSAWRRSGRSRCEDFPAFIVVDDKGNDFFADVSRPVDIGAEARAQRRGGDLRPTSSRSAADLGRADVAVLLAVVGHGRERRGRRVAVDGGEEPPQEHAPQHRDHDRHQPAVVRLEHRQDDPREGEVGRRRAARRVGPVDEDGTVRARGSRWPGAGRGAGSSRPRPGTPAASREPGCGAAGGAGRRAPGRGHPSATGACPRSSSIVGPAMRSSTISPGATRCTSGTGKPFARTCAITSASTVNERSSGARRTTLSSPYAWITVSRPAAICGPSSSSGRR